MTAKLILDLDTGIDDALAIAYALGSPELELIGITCTYGNVTTELAVRNSLAVLALLGRTDIPVFAGSAHATTWKNVHKHLQATAEAMASYVTTDLADMNGRTITAYQGAAGDITHVINAAGTWAGAIGTALDITAFIVQFVHDFVRDAISEVVGSILSYAAELIATVGLAWPIVAEQIATRIASLIGQVGRNVKNLVTM